MSKYMLTTWLYSLQVTTNILRTYQQSSLRYTNTTFTSTQTSVYLASTGVSSLVLCCPTRHRSQSRKMQGHHRDVQPRYHQGGLTAHRLPHSHFPFPTQTSRTNPTHSPTLKEIHPVHADWWLWTNLSKSKNNPQLTTWWRIILFPFRVMNMVKLFKKIFWKFPLDIKIACYLDVKVHFSSSWKEEESWIQA